VDDGDLKMIFNYGVMYSSVPGSDEMTVSKFKNAEIDIVRIFQDQVLGSGPDLGDYRALPPGKLWQEIDSLKRRKPRNEEQAEELLERYRKARYLFHQRISLPFAAITFALFAMVLGIQDQRQGRNLAYVGAIVTIVSAYVFLMSFKWLAENGYMMAPLAAWMPNLLLLSLGSFVVFQRNRLPPSEGVFDPANVPFIDRYFRRRQAGAR
jgi:lipopolysaccharide export system permease protein